MAWTWFPSTPSTSIAEPTRWRRRVPPRIGPPSPSRLARSRSELTTGPAIRSLRLACRHVHSRVAFIHMPNGMHLGGPPQANRPVRSTPFMNRRTARTGPEHQRGHAGDHRHDRICISCRHQPIWGARRPVPICMWCAARTTRTGRWPSRSFRGPSRWPGSWCGRSTPTGSNATASPKRRRATTCW